MQAEVSPKANTKSATVAASKDSLVMPGVERESSGSNPLAPFRTFRSLVACAGISVMGMFSGTSQAATQNLPWRAQWGHPTHVTVTGQGQSYVMTYKQFFDWVGKGKHPNERGIKVVGALPANIAAERAAGSQPAAHPPQGQPATAQTRPAPQAQATAAQYAAWNKYQHDLQRYHYEMAQYQAKLAAWHNAQAQAPRQAPATPYRPTYQQPQQPLGPVQQGSFKAAVKGLGESLWSGLQSIGGDIKQGVVNARYSAAQRAAAQPQLPAAVTPQRAATPTQSTTVKKASAPPATSQPKAKSVAAKPSAPKTKQAAPAPKPAAKPKATSVTPPAPKAEAPKTQAMPEPALPTFDLSQASAATSLLVLPKLSEADLGGSPE